MSKINDAYQSQHTFCQNAVRLVAGEKVNETPPAVGCAAKPAIPPYGSDAAERLRYQSVQNNADSYYIGTAPTPRPLKAPNSSVYLPAVETSATAAPVKKKKRGFFGRIGHALKKFASSKFGKLMLIGGAIAGSFLIPGLGAGLTNLLSSTGRTLMGSAGKVFAQTGIRSLFQGGLKAFVKTQVLPRLGLNGGIKNGITSFLKQHFLSPSALKDGAKQLLSGSGLKNLFSLQSLTGTASKLAAHFGLNRAWLRDLISSDPAPPKNKIETWL